ncbi:MAG: thiamine-phosphate kinase [bacterium]|nr:thiamine-phosphate kinase [bacterium]
MDELEFVNYLQQTFPFGYGKGIGDDASVVKVSAGDHHQLVTKDILIQDVHFSLDYFTLRELALKSLAVNLSDIAAMGGVPQYFYLGLGFPRQLKKEKTIDFFKGLEEGCRQWRVELAGGDFSSSPVMVVSITVIGKAETPVYRGNAAAGDLIGITGVTGESAIGLKLLRQGERSGYFVAKHKDVTPAIVQGPVLSRYVNSMIDVSDGLLMDLNRILTASNKGARIRYEDLPVTPGIKEICIKQGWDEHQTVLAGGEDYVLLFTLSKENEVRLKQENIDYSIIGQVTPQGGVLVVEDRGKPVSINHLGYDHFNRSG